MQIYVQFVRRDVVGRWVRFMTAPQLSARVVKAVLAWQKTARAHEAEPMPDAPYFDRESEHAWWVSYDAEKVAEGELRTLLLAQSAPAAKKGKLQ